ncbi:Ku protein [Mycoplasmatota bacterium]|nr:Ku protein [Mycoplasmatota bacterium]
MGVSWKGSISFGLIFIPISLQIATSEEKIGFNMLHKDCKHRIHYKKVCEHCLEEVKQNEIVKGYQYEEDKYVVFNEQDFEKIKTPKDKSINIEQFVNLDEIDTIFYDKTYYVVPTGGERAFELLKRALIETKKVGIAKTVLGTKESLVALRMSGDKLVLNKMFFLSEIRSVQYPILNIEVNQAEVNLAKQLIENMTSRFQPEIYRDEYIEKIKKAVKQKIEGRKITVTEELPDNNIINLMEALQESVRKTETPTL